MMQSGCAAVGLDWTTRSRARARKFAAGRVALQGNLDPVDAVRAAESACARPRARVLEAFGPAPGHVFNLGHGILPQTPVESVAALVDEVRAYSSSAESRSARQALTYAQFSGSAGIIPHGRVLSLA